MAGTLSGGEQQMLAIGQALMSRPRLILFDEPSLGLAPNLVQTSFDIIAEIRARGTTVLMVEQDAYAALERCNRCYLLESGEITLAGNGQELLDNPHVKEAYLGGLLVAKEQTQDSSSNSARADFRSGVSKPSEIDR